MASARGMEVFGPGGPSDNEDMPNHAHGSHDDDSRAPTSGAPRGDVGWDEMYAGDEPIWSGRPNGALVAEAEHLPAGRALDVGCGEGADAIWLASRGWHVTALDVSLVALERARAAAADAGISVSWVHAGLLEGRPQAGGYDLVSVQYPALRRTPGNDVERTLLAAVAPGGTLLTVFHADVDAEDLKARGIDPEDYVGRDQVAALLDDGWQVEADERRPRSLEARSAGRHSHDLVLKARRLP
jgi:SAM-dependent methyltransferase